MKRTLGVAAAALLLGAPAFAEGQHKQKDRTTELEQTRQGTDLGQGGAGLEGDKKLKEVRAADHPAIVVGDARELVGTVLKVEGQTLYMQHMGAVVPVELQKDTRYEGVANKKALKHGQEIRTELVRQGLTTNVARSVTVHGESAVEGTGGSGAEFENEGYGEDPSGLAPLRDEPIMKNEGAGDTGRQLPTTTGAQPDTGNETLEGTGGAGNVGEELEEQDESGVYQTGDVSSTNPTMVPEGAYPGTATPLPGGDEY